MKQSFRLVLLLFSLLIIAACGQGEVTPESPIEGVSQVERTATTLKTKSFLEISSNKENQEIETTEEREDAEDSKAEASTAAESSANNEEHDNASDSNRSDEEVASSNNQASSAKDSSNRSNDSSANQSSKSSESKTPDTSKQKSQPKQDSKSKPTEKKKTDKESKEENKKPPEPKSTVTVSVTIPSDLDGPNLAPTKVEITDGETAFAATKRLLDSKGIAIDSTGSGGGLYVKGIGGLGEFDAGPLSGWNIYVQDELIPRSADAYEVFNGQTIRWNYTKNYLEN